MSRIARCGQRLGRTHALAVLWLAFAGIAHATPPHLYETVGYQSPVRGEPGDLLMLPGSGFEATDTVVYTSLRDTTAPLAPPSSVPAVNDEDQGVAPIVNSFGTPHSLTVRLPLQIVRNRSYVLWVRNALGEWSNGVRINDARPLWITPAFAYSTAQLAGLPRYLKVVGRNLQPSEFTTQVKLIGPQTYILDAENDVDDATAIEHYVAKVSLPESMPVGTYAVQVRRDDKSWVALPSGTFTVRPDPGAAQEYPVADQGCFADDNDDDTLCILSAIEDARPTGGTVTFGPGTWRLALRPTFPPTSGLVYGEGFVVPVGVSLRGAGASATTVLRTNDWWTPATPGQTEATITLQGGNTVQGFTFKDEHIYTATVSPSVRFLKLGKRFDRFSASDPRSVEDVVITDNIFDRPYVAIGDGGLPIRRLFVTYNVFGAYRAALMPGGYANNTGARFAIDDSVIAHNVFHPGSYLDQANGQGTIASEIGASARMDFSDNVADGATTAYLYSAANDAKGWRAGFFWHMNDSHEMLLVANNEATCTGDKAGDGEAFAFDDNHNKYAFERAKPIIVAGASTIKVAGPLRSSLQGGINVDPARYYEGSWLYIAEGQGLGQSRRIVSYEVDPQTSDVTFTVAPAWDVIPNAGARVTVARLYWQVYTVDNFVDHRTSVGGASLCQKSNRNAAAGKGGGVITYFGRTSDSTIEGNQQFDTDGVLLTNTYKVLESGCAECTAVAATQKSFIEVRGNTIAGEYNWNSQCSRAGIQLHLAAARTASSPPPTLGYGVSIARNFISQADGLRGGAVSWSRSEHAGPPPNDWKLVDNTLMFGNTIADLLGARPPVEGGCNTHEYATRIGINVNHPLTWRTTLSENTCTSVTTPLLDLGNQTRKVCQSPPVNSCECP